MIICSVCGEANDGLATVCVRCHGYLQGKVDALDLFSTAWGLMERPGPTFRKIVLARHKNYVILLSMIAGVGLGMTVLQLLRAGSHGASLPELLGTGVGLGMVGGILLCRAAALLSALPGRIAGGKGTQRNLRAVFAYSLIPYIASVLILFPIRLGIFGRYLFDPNPSPSVVAPLPFYVLLALEGGAVALSAVWYVIGISVACGITRVRALLPAGVVIGAIAGGLIALGG